jgi:hypothetical protein
MREKKPAKKPIDWVLVLKSGPDGLKKWKRLTGQEREKVTISGADLSGCDLTGVNLKG